MGGMDTDEAQRSTTLNDLVASEIRAWMGRKEVTKRELARRLDAPSHTWVVTRARGEVQITLNDLKRIADALDVPWTKLLPERGDANIPYSSQLSERPIAERIPGQHRPNGGRRTFPLAGGIPQTAEVNPAAFGFVAGQTKPFTAVPATLK